MAFIQVYERDPRAQSPRYAALPAGTTPKRGADHHYCARWRDPAGRAKRKTFVLRAEAERFLREIEHDKDRGSYRDPSAGKQTFGDFFAWTMATATNLKPKTLAHYDSVARTWLLPAFGDVPLGSIRREDVITFVSGILAKRSSSTAHGAYRLLRSTLEKAVEYGKIPANPAARIPVKKWRKRPVRFLTPEEVSALAEAVPERYRALILALSYAGLRFGEVAALRVGDLDLMRGRIRIERSVSEVRGKLIEGPTKTGQVRTVRIPASLRDELVDHVARFSDPKDPSAFVFTAPEGGQLRNTTFRSRVFTKAVKRAELNPAPTIHDLRHTSVGLAIEAGYHAKEIQQMLGHASIVVTYDVYGHLLDSTQEASVERLDAVLRSSQLRSAAKVTALTAGR